MVASPTIIFRVAQGWDSATLGQEPDGLWDEATIIGYLFRKHLPQEDQERIGTFLVNLHSQVQAEVREVYA